jgi:ABC-type uncharacterized transport system fused permease/ATPase subunit
VEDGTRAHYSAAAAVDNVLPQQPYLTLGSLRDQLFYALPPRTHVSEARLLSVLRDVQLETILERAGGLDVEQRAWASILSLGEQQNLAFARLLLAVPEFAFLDEAVSALPAERVRNLYELLSQTTTTYISIGRASDLLEYHHQLLQMQGDGTWTDNVGHGRDADGRMGRRAGADFRLVASRLDLPWPGFKSLTRSTVICPTINSLSNS